MVLWIPLNPNYDAIMYFAFQISQNPKNKLICIQIHTIGPWSTWLMTTRGLSWCEIGFCGAN